MHNALPPYSPWPLQKKEQHNIGCLITYQEICYSVAAPTSKGTAWTTAVGVRPQALMSALPNTAQQKNHQIWQTLPYMRIQMAPLDSLELNQVTCATKTQ